MEYFSARRICKFKIQVIISRQICTSPAMASQHWTRGDSDALPPLHAPHPGWKAAQSCEGVYQVNMWTNFNFYLHIVHKFSGNTSSPPQHWCQRRGHLSWWAGDVGLKWDKWMSTRCRCRCWCRFFLEILRHLLTYGTLCGEVSFGWWRWCKSQ